MLSLGYFVLDASEVGKKKVDYFRGKDFKKFLLENDTILNKKCTKALEETLEGAVPENDRDCERLGNELIQRNFCYKARPKHVLGAPLARKNKKVFSGQAMYKPLNATSKSDDGSEKKPKKWPDRLGRAPNQSFDCEGPGTQLPDRLGTPKMEVGFSFWFPERKPQRRASLRK